MMTVLHSECTALNKLVMIQEKWSGLRASECTSIRGNVAEWKTLVVQTFQDHFCKRLIALLIHPLDSLTENLGKVESMWMLGTLSSRQLNVHAE